MQKVDLEAMSIEDLAKLRDQATEKLAEKIAARQRELAAEMERLNELSRKAKAPAPKKEAPREAAAKETAKEAVKAQPATKAA